jgi:putative membrane protein
MKFFLEIIKGIFIGAGAILPGISSGVLCVAFGIYEKILDSVLGFFNNTKENFKFLFPLVIGIVIGIILFGNILKYLFSTYNVLSSFCFAGLVLGSIPSILKQAQVHKLRFYHILALLLTFSCSICLVLIEKNGHSYIYSNNSAFSFTLTGFAMSAGVVIPGVSSTVILMLLGKYDYYLSAISSLNLKILFPLGIGLALGAIVLLLFIKFMFRHFKSLTYFAIIGFILGSIPVLIPNITKLGDIVFGAISIVFGLLVSIKLSALH